MTDVIEQGGFTVVVTAYDRPRALRTLLGGLASQRLDGVPMELMIWNNADHVQLAPSPWTATGRLLRLFPGVKIVNSRHNWLARARYALTTLARHNTIVFLDDDVVIRDEHFLKYLYDSFAGVRRIDILSCWTALWTAWNDDCLEKVRMNFSAPAPDVGVECDYVGPGLCIFDRRILVDSGLLALPAEFHRSDSTWFPWLTAMKVGTRKYYLPSYGRVEFHDQYQRHALMQLPGFRREMYAQYKTTWKRGYVPVLERRRLEPDFDQSPEAHAARTLPVETDRW